MDSSQKPGSENELVEFHLNQFAQLYDGKPWLGKSFKELLKDITPKQAFVNLHGEQHSMAELLSHIIGWCEIVINRIVKNDKPRLKQVESFDPYRFGKTKEEVSAISTEKSYRIAKAFCIL